MNARDDAWFGGPGQDPPMPVLRKLAAEEIRRVTRSVRRPPRNLLLLALGGFLRWCIRERGLTDGHGITEAVAKEFRVMLRRSGVKRRVWELLHRDATRIVLDVIVANRGVCHPDPGNHLLYVPIAGEIWEHPEREFGVLYPG
jgi:hypothetical protein